MKRILKYEELFENFKNPKDQDLYLKIVNVLKQPLTQLDICKKLGFESYDMRTTMVIREMTVRGELLKSDGRPMMFSLNPDYKEGETPRIQTQPKEPKTPKEPKVGKGKLSLAQLQDLMKKVEIDFRYWNPGGHRGDYPTAEWSIKGQQFELSADFRHLGDWEHDYDDYDRDEYDFEDDDNMIWSSDSRKFYRQKFHEWLLKQSWSSNIVSWGIDTSEKNWAYFNITIGNKTSDDAQREKQRLIRQKEEEQRKKIAEKEAKAKAKLDKQREKEISSKRSKVKGEKYNQSIKNLEYLQEDFIEYKKQLKKVFKSNSPVIREFDEKYKLMKTTIKKIISKNPDFDWKGKIEVSWYNNRTRASIGFYVGAYISDLMNLYSTEWTEHKREYSYGAVREEFASRKQMEIIQKSLGLTPSRGSGYVTSGNRVLYKISSMEA